MPSVLVSSQLLGNNIEKHMGRPFISIKTKQKTCPYGYYCKLLCLSLSFTFNPNKMTSSPNSNSSRIFNKICSLSIQYLHFCYLINFLKMYSLIENEGKDLLIKVKKAKLEHSKIEDRNTKTW
jgi:hypothetical protein